MPISFTGRSLSTRQIFAPRSTLQLEELPAPKSMRVLGHAHPIIRRRQSSKQRVRCMHSILLRQSRDSTLAHRIFTLRLDASRNSSTKRKRKVASEFASSPVCLAPEKL